MRSGLFRLLVLVFLFMSSVVMAKGYEVYTDEYGDIYLKAPDKLVVLPERKATPIFVPSPNGLLRLYEVNGQWQVQLLSKAEWELLNLTQGHDQIESVQKADFDGDGKSELFIALNHLTANQLLLRDLEGNPSIESSYFERMELTGGIGQDRPVFSTFALLNPTTTVGLSSGEFRVDESGNANYSMPLALPDGIAGVKPQLAFSYSSAAGDGYMGAGWSLAGASAITRCPKNLAVDTVQGNVAFAASDRLCLDGQRLVKNGASNDKAVTDASYWATATEFHTELDGFAKIRQHGIASQGPRAFTVETKSGEIHYYGDVTAVSGTDSMNKALTISLKNASGGAETGADAFFDTSLNSNLARMWALKAIRDVKGNYIVFKYHEDQALGEHYLTEVHYTGRSGGNAPFAKVVLNYVDNTKIAIGWQAQQRVGMTKLLDTVEVFQDSALYRKYLLNYFNTNVLEEKNYLLSIQECAGSSANQCYAPTTFDWNRPAAVSTTYTTRCANEPGTPQYCWQEPVTKSYSPFISLSQTKGSSVDRYNQKIIDINGDGFADLVYPRGGAWQVRLGGASGSSDGCRTPAGEPTQCTPAPLISNFATEQTLTSTGIAKKEYAQTIDFNGDGQRDLLVADSANSNWFIISFIPSVRTERTCEPYPDEEICGTYQVNSNYSIVPVGFKATGLEGGALVADYDGDGLEDIVFVSGNVFQAYRNRGSGTNNVHLGFEHKANLGSVAAGAGQMGWNMASFTADAKSTAAIDVNGDGRTDLLIKVTEGQCSVEGFLEQECYYEGHQWSVATTWRLYLSTGTGYAHHQVIENNPNLRAVDLNGDGYTDLMYQSGTTWYYQLSNGNTLLPARSSGLTSAANLLNYVYFLDLNADGRTDVLLPTATNSWKVMLSRPSKVHEQVLFEQRGTRSFDNTAAIQFADIDADGKLDLLTATNDAGWKIFRNNRAYFKDHSIRKITNGWGVSTIIEYQAIADQNVYVRQDSANNNSSDYFSPRAGMSVVSKVSTEVKPNQFVSVSYQYGGLLIDKKGRGFLGFEMLRTTDNQSAVVTETLYHQLWPYTGIPKSTLQTRAGHTLSFSTNTVAQRITSYDGVYPYIASSTEHSYSLNTALTASSHLATTNSSFSYDGYGNLTSSTVTISDPANAANKLLTETSNTFNSTTTYQRYGRLTASTVRKRLYVNNAVTSDISRQSSFSYNADYLLETEVFAPNLAAAKSTTTYGYDAAGNKTSVKVNAGTGANGAAATDRTSSSNYTANFRYVASSTDAMGKTSSYRYNGVAATSFTPTLITSITAVSPNNQSSTTNFDAFGQSTSSSVKGALSGDIAVTGTVTKSFCSGCETLFPDAYIKVVTSSVTGAEQQQFIDK
ncbi:hypothetical protein EMM73_10755, partial [Rheinheimera sediminis]|uniref:toxin TcdB middle/N-terminal domain-containing protein n=1 Tax=Rheinheimera sp. YQF-1 TaxID=2499626 RepID=UPI000FE1291D